MTEFEGHLIKSDFPLAFSSSVTAHLSVSAHSNDVTSQVFDAT